MILDDDPTGSQEASGVAVLIEYGRDELHRLLRSHVAVFVITNARALEPGPARALLERIRDDLSEIAREESLDIEVVLRGDSTLRGHVLLEADVFGAREGLTVLVPAYPAAGRVTRDGTHLVRIDGGWLNAADTEFASDPVFGYSARTLPDYVRELEPGRPVLSTSPADLRDASRAANGTVLTVDATNDEDLRRIAASLREVRRSRHVVVRCAAPLAADLAGVRSAGLLHVEPKADERLLIVVGSHTGGAATQLERLLAARPGLVVRTIATDVALRDPAAAAAEHVKAVRHALQHHAIAAIVTERARRPEHGTLDHGSRVMTALSTLTARVADLAGTVVAKGGITSARIAVDGIGATTGTVIGQIATGISLWDLDAPGRTVRYISVPGNIGGPDALAGIADAVLP